MPRKSLDLRFTETLFKYQKVWLVLLALATGVFAYNLKNIRIDNSVEALLSRDTDALKAFKTFTEVFGNAEVAVVAFRDEQGIVRPEILQQIADMSARIQAEVPHVAGVVSLTNVQVMDPDGGGGLSIHPILNLDAGMPSDPAVLQGAEARAQAEPFSKRTLISDDGKTTSIVVKTVYLEGNQTYRKEITVALKKIVNEFHDKTGHVYYLGGPPIFLTDFDQYIFDDLVTFTPLVLIVLAGLLYLTFRSVLGVLMPLGMVLVGALWTFGLMAILGYPITLATTIIPPLLLVTGIEDSIYVLSFFNIEAQKYGDRKKRAFRTSLYTNIACLLTSVTTSIGFGTLAITDINAVYQTGIASGLGTLFLWVANNMIMPLLLQWVRYQPRQTNQAAETDSRQGAVAGILEAINRMNLKHTRVVFGVGIAVVLAFVPGISKLHVETTLIKYFHEASPIRVAHDFLEKNLSGVAPLEVLVDTKKENGMKDPAILAEVAQIEKTLNEDMIVNWTFSTSDFITMLDKALNPSTAPTTDAVAATAFPVTDPAAVGQYLFLYKLSGGEAGLSDFMSSDGRYGRISARLRDVSTTELKATIDKTQAKFGETNSGASYSFADNSSMFVGIVDAMLLNTVQSFLLAAFVIWLLIAVYLKSLKVASLFMIPNVIPIIVVLGTMGYAGIDVNLSTMMIGSIAIGIAVDNSIHIFAHFPKALAHLNGDVEKATTEVMHTVGRAAISSSTAIIFGFLVLTLSKFYPNFYFGTLSAFTLAVALASTLTVSYTIWIMLARSGYRGPAHMLAAIAAESKTE